MIESHHEIEGRIRAECRFYIGSIGTDAACFAGAVRGR
jgi:hypothetical protein